MQKLETDGDGKSAVATTNGKSRKKLYEDRVGCTQGWYALPCRNRNRSNTLLTGAAYRCSSPGVCSTRTLRGIGVMGVPD